MFSWCGVSLMLVQASRIAIAPIAVVAVIGEQDPAFSGGGKQVCSAAASMSRAFGHLDHDGIDVGIDHSLDLMVRPRERPIQAGQAMLPVMAGIASILTRVVCWRTGSELGWATYLSPTRRVLSPRDCP